MFDYNGYNKANLEDNDELKNKTKKIQGSRATGRAYRRKMRYKKLAKAKREYPVFPYDTATYLAKRQRGEREVFYIKHIKFTQKKSICDLTKSRIRNEEDIPNGNMYKKYVY